MASVDLRRHVDAGPSPRAGARRTLLFVSLAVIGMSSAFPAHALGSPLRQLASSVTAFSSDGVRYAAWQVHAGSPIVVFDTRTGHRASIGPPAGCQLEPQAGEQPEPTAAAGYFLLYCTPPNGQEQKSILNLKTGTSTVLPEGATGFNWHLVLGHDVEGWADEHTCQRHRTPRGPGEVCMALYDLATGGVTDRPGWQVPDLDRPGAPPVCKALRSTVLADKESGLPKFFSYADGVLAHPARRPGAVEIDHCNGRPVVLGGHGEPVNFDVRGGLLTWDTGHHATSFEAQEDVSRGTLTSYGVRKGGRRSWALPNLTLGGAVLRPEYGVFGYSTHTANMVFWVASRTLGAEEKSLFVKASSVFAAPLR
jgi:hypothetical protein